ncbi:MAG: glycosyltransferase family 2 protein [Pirellulales bacterium]
MSERFLTALPVYNEVRHVSAVLEQVLRYSRDVLVVDDGSTDGTSESIASRGDIFVQRHKQNKGYGAALRTAFLFAIERGYQALVTIDCDGQHQPQRIPQFVDALLGSPDPPPDIVSGSRYLEAFPGDAPAPEERRNINLQITAELNRMFGLQLTDAFCGFKAYRGGALPQLVTKENGYGMPLELWVRATQAGMRIVELPIPLVYLEEERSFGGALDDGGTRFAYYQEIIRRSLADVQSMSDDGQHDASHPDASHRDEGQHDEGTRGIPCEESTG